MAQPRLAPAQPVAVEASPAPKLPWYRSHYCRAGLAFAVLTLLFSWRIWGSLTLATPGGDIDGFENVWNDWWVRQALLERHTNPLFTSYIYYPTGVSLRLHALQMLNGLLTIGLAPLFGPVGSTNLTFVWAIWSTAFSSYLLFYYLTQKPLAAWAGAAFFGFCNFQQYEFWGAGQGNLVSLEWLPLYALFMFKVGRGERHTRLNIALASGLLLFLTLTDLQYLLFAILLTGLYGLYLLAGSAGWPEKGRAIGRLALSGAIYGLVALPLLLIPAIVEISQSPWLWPSQDQSQFKASSLTDYLGWEGRNLGYIPLALGLLGVIVGWRKTGTTVRFWLVVASFFGMLSLGPTLLIGATPLKLMGYTLPLPYAWFSQLPGMRVGRNPSLYGVMWMLAIAASGTYGLGWLLAKWANRTRRSPVLLVGAITTLAVGPLLVGAALSYPLDRLEVSPFYEQLAQDKTDYAILELPSFTERGRGEDVYQAYQVVHNKGRFGGRLSRDHKLDNPNNFLKTNTLFRDFFLLGEGNARNLHPAKDVLPSPDFKQIGLPLLNFYNVRYIVLYKAAMTKETGQVALSLVAQVLGQVRPVYEDQQLIAYRVPDGPNLSQNSSLFADVGEGWYGAESRNGETWRWANQAAKAEIYLYNLTSQAKNVRLDLTSYSFKTERELVVKFNDQLLPGSYHLLETYQPFTFELKLAPGRNVISFSSPQPGRSVLDYGFKNDSRVLSFAILGAQLSPASLSLLSP